MLDLLDTAHPILTLTMVAGLVMALIIISRLNARLRVLENRIDSTDFALRGHDDALELLSPQRAILAEQSAQQSGDVASAMDALGPRNTEEPDDIPEIVFPNS